MSIDGVHRYNSLPFASCTMIGAHFCGTVVLARTLPVFAILRQKALSKKSLLFQRLYNNIKPHNHVSLLVLKHHFDTYWNDIMVDIENQFLFVPVFLLDNSRLDNISEHIQNQKIRITYFNGAWRQSTSRWSRFHGCGISP